MTSADFTKALAATREVELRVIGRISQRTIALPVWFVHEGEALYLLPVKGSDSHWYKNILRTPTATLATKGATLSVDVKPITDPGQVGEVVEKFKAKYGAANVRRYYRKFDVAAQVRLG
jgi:hypothetical protein